MTRVMIVDDAATVRMYHRQLMESIGFQVIEAANGIEAIEKWQNDTVDLFIVDVNMPKMDGYTLVREIRRTARVRGAPVIFVSTESEARDRDAALRAGANWYVVKPADEELLKSAAVMLTGRASA